MERYCPVCEKTTLQRKLCGECDRWFCDKCRHSNGEGILEDLS